MISDKRGGEEQRHDGQQGEDAGVFQSPDRGDPIQEHDGMFHKNSFDVRRLSRLLTEHSFKTDFSFAPYPHRPTPSLLIIARKYQNVQF